MFEANRNNYKQDSDQPANFHLCYSMLGDVKPKIPEELRFTIMILIFPTDRSGQTVQTQIRLLLEEQSDQSLHCFAIPFASF